MIRSKHPFYRTFTHGSTLGLYEVLTKRPYICDVVMDSIAFCLFIEADKIISCLQSDPSMEDFLWQESAIFLSKLLVPQIFEKLTMQDLRALNAERSEMAIYIRGETIEIPHHSVAFLLEGQNPRSSRTGNSTRSPASFTWESKLPKTENRKVIACV